MRVPGLSPVPALGEDEVRHPQAFFEGLPAPFRDVTEQSVAEPARLAREQLDAEGLKVVPRVDRLHGTPLPCFRTPG